MLAQDPARDDYALVPESWPEGTHCPLLTADVTFEAISENLGLSDETAKILDDITFLTVCVHSASPGEERKIHTTASWLHSRLKAMPPAVTTTSKPDSESNYIQDAVRSAAIIYTWAISSVKAMSEFSDSAVRHDLFISAQSVDLHRWKAMPGLYLWVMLVACSGAPRDTNGRFLARKMAVAAVSVGFRHFPLSISCVRSFWQVQRWIAGGQSQRTRAYGAS